MILLDYRGINIKVTQKQREKCSQELQICEFSEKNHEIKVIQDTGICEM